MCSRSGYVRVDRIPQVHEEIITSSVPSLLYIYQHSIGEEFIDDEASFDDNGHSGRTRRRSSSSSSSSDGGSGSCGSDGSSEEEEEERGDGGHRERPGMMMMVRQAPKFTIGGGGSDIRRLEEVRHSINKANDFQSLFLPED